MTAQIKTGGLVDRQLVLGVVHSVGQTAIAVSALGGIGSKNRIDAVASEVLGANLVRSLPDHRLESYLSEGLKDHAPCLDEGTSYGSGREGLLVTDPVECTGQLAKQPAERTRRSYVLSAVAPNGTIPRLYSGCRASKMVLPPGTPMGGIDLDTPPDKIVPHLAMAFNCRPWDIHVWILEREWNQQHITEFGKAGARVRPIEAGDVEAHLLAGRPVAPGGPVHVSYGIGGLPEGVLVVPYLKASGASLLLKPDPLGQHRAEIERAGCSEMLGRTFTKDELIASKDCLFVAAGITDVPSSEGAPRIVRGVERSADGLSTRVEAIAASPLWDGFIRYSWSYSCSEERCPWLD